MLKTPGLISSFAQGMSIPEHFFASEARLKQEHENLIRAQTLNKYLPQQQQDLLQQAADNHLIQHMNLEKLKTLAPYWAPQAAAGIQKTRVSSTLAPALAHIAAQNAMAKLMGIQQSQSRFGPLYKARQAASAFPSAAKSLIAAKGGALPVVQALSGLTHQAASQVGGMGAPPGPQAPMPQQVQIPSQLMPLPSPGQQGVSAPLGAPQQAPPSQPQIPIQQPQGQPPQPQAPGGAPPPIQAAQGLPPGTAPPVNLQEAAQQAQQQQQIELNKKSVSSQIWNRSQAASVLEDQFNDPGFRGLAKNATKFAGGTGGAKAFAQSLETMGTPEYNKYQQFMKITVPNLSNQIRQMEGLSTQPTQRKEIEGMLTAWNQGLSRLTSNPVRALQFMNESGREFNVIARSLQKQAHPLYPAQNPIGPWDPIGKDSVSLSFKNKQDFQNWMKSASPSQIKAEIAKLQG